MGAILGGTMRSPFTGIVFAIELTHDLNMLLPLVVASFIAHTFTVLTLKRSILTEKISRRGYHLSREYALDPLEILFVREVMRTKVVVLPATATLEQARELMRPTHKEHGQHIFPVVENDNHLIGLVSRNHMLKLFEEAKGESSQKHLREIASGEPVVAFSDEPLRVVVYRMVETGFTRLPVVDPEDEKRLLGIISLDDLLRARSRNLEEERARERVLRLRMPLGRQSGSAKIPVTEGSDVTEHSDLKV
jgi:CBS domain-containing protein